MIHSGRFKAVLDANVLFPIVQRDILFWFAFYDLFTPVWSKHILSEFEKVVREKLPGNSELQIRKIVDKPNLVFPEACISNYTALIDSIDLKDQNDRHVVAVAIKSNSNVIVTNNLRDFPDHYLVSLSIEAKSPDDFLCDIIDLDHERSCKAFKDMVLNRKNPDMSEFEVLEMLRNNQLKNTADFIHSLI